MQDEINYAKEVALSEERFKNLGEKLDKGFSDIKNDMKNLATKSELELLEKTFSSKISALETREMNDINRQSDNLKSLGTKLDDTQKDSRKKLLTSTILTAVVISIITMLATHFLEGLMK